VKDAEVGLAEERRRLATRRFGMADQLAFAALSGDYNPMHVDVRAARRTQAGAPVVHGMHGLLWALDALAAAELIGPRLCEIRAQFRKFSYLDVACDLVATRVDADAARAELCSNGVVLTTIQLRNGQRQVRAEADSAELAALDAALAGRIPRAPALEDLAGLRGRIAVPGAAEDFESVFPQLARVIGTKRVGALAALSRLVGMVCPGLHSIFAGLSVNLVESQSRHSGTVFEVTKVNQRFRMIGMDVLGSNISGTVTAFMRWPPVEAPSMGAISAMVTADKFAGAAALIVGGSRGLGAVTAKAIAAGGGRVVVTYKNGRDEALELAAEINAVRGSDVCTALSYDSSTDAASQLSDLTEDVNQLYYFATPPIFARTSDLFSPEKFRQFCSVYIDGFDNVCRFVRARSRVATVAAFYPSSVAVEEVPPGLVEYAMAKAAGELLCAGMMRQVSGLKVVVARLPRVLTDQTATIAQVENADPLTIILPFIDKLQEPV
jgi:acyl dehydratase/NAD(P)-dependent dehydrogenase (short-subunit alcohol dehydrogenase family)